MATQKYSVWRIIAGLLLLTAVMVAVLFAFFELHNPETLPIKQVRVQGNLRYLELAQLEKTAGPYASGNFFFVDVEALYAELMRNSWIEKLVIKRVWPDTLVLLVTERVPVARWNKSALIDRNGVLFQPDKDVQLQQLPILVGPQGQHGFVYQQWMTFNQHLKPIGLAARRVSLSSRFALDVELDNGVLLRLGKEQWQQRLLRFVSMYPVVAPATAQVIRYVDLRYTNGIAIGS